jgi:hypothetical protein
MSVNPTVLLVITVVIIIYYVLFASLGQPGTGGISAPGGVTTPTSGGVVFLEVLLWGVFVMLVLLNGMSYMFNIDVTASIKNIFSRNPEIDILVDPEDLDGDIYETGGSSVPEIKIEKQVFHIPNNKYTYPDAKAVCKAYGGRLATYKELDNAYQSGADWCGYGWSDGQMALYPTQYDKWENLQDIKGHEHDCGRPGINGGYIDNKNVRFGANCYGYKPEITSEEAELMQNTSLYPKTKKEHNFERRVEYWRQKLPEILVAPFNHNNWSII